jgi:translocation and assembly module TamB
LVALVVILAVPAAVLALLWTGWADNTLRGAVVGQLTRMTGGTVELGKFHFNPWRLQVTVDDLTIHGREPAGAPPFLHINRLAVELRLESFWRRKISVGDVEVSRPAVYVRVEANGASNVPTPPGAISGRPLRQRLFDLVVQRLRIVDGTMLFNDVRIPLAAEGGAFEFALDYSDPQGRPSYLGDFRWQQMRVSAWRYLPFPADVTARFTLEPDSFSVTQLALMLPHTSLDAQLSLASFIHPAWSFRYRGRLDFVDLQTILRNPGIPGGHTDFLGDGQFADGKLALNGSYSAEQIAFHFQWFHTAGITSRGTYHADRSQLEVPDFVAHIFGGDVKGHVHLDFKGLLFRTDTRGQAVDLASLLAAVDNEDLPVVPLHWHGLVEIQDTTTWTANFKNLDSRGVTLWAPPSQSRAGEIPVTAQINYHYSMIGNNVSLEPSEITTPSSSVQFNGVLAERDSALNAVFDSQDIAPWDDFINRLRGINADPKVISGNFHWQGQLTGPLVGPTFAGHVKGSNARYDRLYWDELEGDMSYSPDGFSFVRANARRGVSSAQFEFSLALDDWDFLPESTWSFDVTLVRTETAGLQELLGTSFPLQGLLSGNFKGMGTRADPQVSGLFDIISPQAWGWRLDRARGEFAFDQREIRISNAELRLPAPPAPSGAQTAEPAGVVTGNFRYGRIDQQTEFNLTGALLPLEGISRIQTARLPIGGQLSFQLTGQGPLLAPKVDGSVRLVNLRLGSEIAGSFAGKLDSDGNRLTLQLDSAMTAGALHGQIEVALRGDYPISGQVNIMQLNLNALISSALHLTALTAPSRVDGSFTVSGALLRPETLEVQADISRVLFDFENVALENSSPVQFAYRQDEIRITQANFRGPESDFHISGLARFAGDRQLGLQVSGAFNLRLLAGLVPSLDAVGPGQIDAAIFGTLTDPRVTGRAHVNGASLRYGDFPAGLSTVTGDFVFDASRMVFDNVSAEVGGGKMVLGGALSYNGPPRYDVTARAEQVRIRYPLGMSWHADGTLRLTGTAQAATLSGRVTVDRLLLSDAVDLTALLGNSQKPESYSLESSAFLRNLELDVQASTTPNATLEWPSGNFQAESNVRLRGTWENPILLGNIHLLGGYMEFRGDRYQLSRGEINFGNPFRLDPVLNIEATTRIQQYEITVNFSGAASHLTMSYRSEPPLPSNDVVTLLALGETGEESALRGVNGAQTPQLGATTLLSEAFSSQLGGRIQRLFGISHFSVDPFLAGSTAPSQSSAARVTVEQRFSPDLTVTYVTNVGGTSQQVIQIEYAVRRDISIVALRDDTGTFGIDVIFRKYFK